MTAEHEPLDPFATEASVAAAAEGDAPEAAERDRETRRAIEAVLMAATEPVEPGVLAQLTEVPVAAIEAAVTALADEYEADGRGFVVARVAGGYRFQTAPDLAPYVERFVLEGQHARLSGAALETLAIVAYKQPISRSQVSAIRGVNVDAVLQTLAKRGYVDEVARDPGPGQAVLYGTTRTFLERLELDSLDDLPALGDFVPDASIVEVLECGLRVTEDAATDAAAGPNDDVVAEESVEDDAFDLADAYAVDGEEAVDAETAPGAAVVLAVVETEPEAVEAEIGEIDVIEIDVVEVEVDAVTEDQALDLADAYALDGEEAVEAEADELVVVDETRIVGDAAIETVEVFEVDRAEAGAIDAEGPRSSG